MAVSKNFRTALGGFNRQDVVRYIEYMNSQHAMELEQLNSQLQLAQEKQGNDAELKAQLEAAQARCAELEAQLGNAAQGIPVTGDELEAYRRAERAERLANDRAAQIYAQANAALADATVKIETISDSMSSLTQQLESQMQDAKAKLQEAVASMYAIRPEEK
ncbi:MAG: hypothetical protein J6Q92_04980 [Oscillospiraceae bacterium]|nr:hypothetical protein [Oscillospiraceae bacterium]